MMESQTFNMGDIDIAWCPGCGNFSILKILKLALAELDIKPERLVLVSGIGQAAKIPHYFRVTEICMGKEEIILSMLSGGIPT
jgi:2-oxoglutarate ferredoxin oxidoreductase subunit beta